MSTQEAAAVRVEAARAALATYAAKAPGDDSGDLRSDPGAWLDWMFRRYCERIVALHNNEGVSGDGTVRRFAA